MYLILIIITVPVLLGRQPPSTAGPKVGIHIDNPDYLTYLYQREQAAAYPTCCSTQAHVHRRIASREQALHLPSNFHQEVLKQTRSRVDCGPRECLAWEDDAYLVGRYPTQHPDALGGKVPYMYLQYPVTRATLTRPTICTSPGNYKPNTS